MRFFENNFRSFLLASLTFALFACGGSCGGCSACGVEPIPGGYPIGDRIENAMQVRLTSSGIDFVETNIDAIVRNFLADGLDFDIPEVTQSFAGISFTICRGGMCKAHAEIQSAEITPVAPNRLAIHLRLTLDSRNAAGARAAWPGTCDIDVDTRRGSRPYVGLVADIDLVVETRAARAGYTKVVASNVMLASGEDIENADIDISGGFLGSCGLLDIGFIKGLIIGQIQGQFGDLIQGAIDDQLCTTQGEYGCPTGTVADGPDPGDTCRFTSGGDCVPILLGTDGQGDLGAAFLGSVSPGTHAPGQFLLASGGDGEAVNMGYSLFFYGGYRGTDLSFMTSPAHNPCVPVVDPPVAMAIPRADTFRGNTIPGGGTAHVGIGISETFLNQAGYGMFDSGLLCLGAGTRLSQQLSTGLFSLLIRSIGSVTYPETTAPMSIALRPQLPPVFEIGAGTDAEPLLTVTLPQLDLDFYVWSTERYVRILTYSADLSIPINLRVEDGAIVPEITTVGATNSEVTNSDLLTEDPADLADLLQTVISMFAGMLTGGLSPISLPDLMGFELDVPPGGIVGVADSGEEFLGIFANLALASGSGMVVSEADTRAELDAVHIDPTALALETFGQGDVPSVRVEAEAIGPSGVDYEYSYRIDGMQWSPWTRESVLDIQNRAFLLQARHEVDVRSRAVGYPESVDTSPAQVEVLVDVLAPFVEVARQPTGATITASDVISPREALEMRYRIDGGAWTDWQPLPAGAFVPLPNDDSQMDVEVRDEAGNVGASRAAIIRGLPNPAATGGCSCDAPGGGPGAPLVAIGVLLGLGLFLRRRRWERRRWLKRLLGHLAVFLVFAIGGCHCGGDDSMMMMPGPCMDACTAAVPPATSGSLCCPSTDMCVSYDTSTLCEPGLICSGPAAVVLDDSCAVSCNDCITPPPLEPGILATHLDMAVEDDGTVALSGYSPGLPGGFAYGDLVFGTWDAAAMSVDWEIVDGAPASPITNAIDGWRGGVSDPGDDVGRWTSLGVSGGTYYIAYYDKTHGSLKLARGTPGSWSVSVVDDTGDSGRYASIAFDASGNPSIAYLQIVQAGDGSGRVISSARVASASSPTPAGPTDWSSTEIGAADMACRQQFCDSGTCLENGLCATDTGDCGACGSGETCYMGACVAELADPYVEDMPPALGMYDCARRDGRRLRARVLRPDRGEHLGRVLRRHLERAVPHRRLRRHAPGGGRLGHRRVALRRLGRRVARDLRRRRGGDASLRARNRHGGRGRGDRRRRDRRHGPEPGRATRRRRRQLGRRERGRRDPRRLSGRDEPARDVRATARGRRLDDLGARRRGQHRLLARAAAARDDVVRSDLLAQRRRHQRRPHLRHGVTGAPR